MDGANLEGLDLSNRSLRGARLGHANLLGASLRESDLHRADLRGAQLGGADLNGSHCFSADFRGADLRAASISRAVFMGADLTGAKLTGCDAVGAILTVANLDETDFRDANLTMASLVAASVEGATFSGARVYGASTWDLRGMPRHQRDLIVTPQSEADVTVDSLGVAQFVFLLSREATLGEVVDTLTSKVVLLLGRFSAERKLVLDALRSELRRLNLTPIIFDSAKPTTRGYGETVTLLARLARYLVVDLTDATEVRSELMQIVPAMPRLPVQPLLLSGAAPYETFATDIDPYPWVLPIHRYESPETLAAELEERVLQPLAKARTRLLA